MYSYNTKSLIIESREVILEFDDNNGCLNVDFYLYESGEYSYEFMAEWVSPLTALGEIFDAIMKESLDNNMPIIFGAMCKKRERVYLALAKKHGYSLELKKEHKNGDKDFIINLS